MNIKDKKIIVFDLDGTIAESKSKMDKEMSELLVALLRERMVAVIGGGAYYKFEEQFIVSFDCPEELKSRLFLFPTSASCFYRYDGEWKKVYEDLLSEEERKKIKWAFEQTFKDIGYQHPAKVFGELVEDRGTQVSFSALGQEAPLEFKKQWRHSKDDRRVEMKERLDHYLPEFQVQIPGYTTIDVTRQGVNKGYGIMQIEKYIGVPVSAMVFVGDALYEGGNDYPVIATGIDYISVEGPAEVKVHIRTWLAELGVAVPGVNS